MPRADSLGGPAAQAGGGAAVRISQRRSSQRRSFNYDKNPRRSLSASIHAPNRGVFKRSSMADGESESGADQTGTVGGVTFNTLCCVMGAGVLSLPYATRNGSVGFSLILMLITTLFSAFGVYILACGCDITKKYSYTECLAYALFPDMPLAERRAKQLEAKKRRKEERRIQEETKRELAGIDPSHNQSTLQESANQPTNTTTLVSTSRGAELSTVCSSAAASDDDISSDNDSDLDEGIYDPATEGRNRKLRRWITMVMEAIIFLNNYGTITVYSRVIADSIPPVLNDFFGADGVWTSTWLWIVGPGIIFFLLSCARGMEELKWTSMVGFATIFYVVCLVITRYFTNMNDPISESMNMKDGVAADVNWFTISLTCFSTISTYGLAFGYHYNVPYFYRELADRRPAVMMETVSLAFPVISICYISTGLLGYLTFGSRVADSHAEGNIINNYDSHDVAANIGRLGLFFHFAPVYPIISICCRRALHRLTCLAFVKPVPPTTVADGAAAADITSPPMSPLAGNNNNTDAEEKLPLVVPTIDADSGAPPGDPSTTRQSSIIIEAVVIVSTSALIAAFVPGIGVVVELVGALFGIPLMFLFPGMIGYQIFKDELAPYLFAKSDLQARSPETTKKYIKWLRWGSIVIGLLGAVFQFCGLLAFFLTQTGVIH